MTAMLCVGRPSDWWDTIISNPDRVAEIDGCWFWLGARTGSGYGKLRRGGKTLGAHRCAYEQHVGPIPPGLHVLHRCDNRPCVNPEHLFVGTASDNARDMHRKGRGHGRGAAGGRNPHAVLTEPAVLEIRHRYSSGATLDQLTSEYGIKRDSIARVLKGETWRSVGGPVVAGISRRRRAS